MNQSKLYKIIGVLSLTSVLLFVVIYFAYDDIKSKNEKVSAVEHELLFQNSQYDYLISMQKMVDGLGPDIYKIDNSIVPKNGDVDFIEDLEKLAKDRKLKIEIESLTISTDPKESSGEVVTLKVRAKVEGPWKDSYLFISEVESFPFKVKINKLSIVGTEEVVSGTGKLNTINSKWQTTFEINVLKYK